MRNGTKDDNVASRPRGRPRAYEPEIALRQAADAFWKAGYAGTSLDDISAATGMNRPSLRAAFGDKRELYIKALNDYWELKFATLGQALAGSENLQDSLLRAYDAALSVYFSGQDSVRGCFVIATAITQAPADAEIQRIVAQGFGRLDREFEARFKRARATGELKAQADPKTLAVLAAATMQTLAIRARAGSSKSELRKLAHKAVNAICA